MLNQTEKVDSIDLKFFVLCFIGLLITSAIHEFGHFILLKSFNYTNIRFTLGAIKIDENISANHMIIISIAGPIATLLLIGILRLSLNISTTKGIKNLIAYLLFTNYLIFAATLAGAFIPGSDLNSTFHMSILLKIVSTIIGLLMIFFPRILIRKTNSNLKMERQLFFLYVVFIFVIALVSTSWFLLFLIPVGMQMRNYTFIEK